MLLDLADFALQEQPEDNLMVPISRALFKGSHTTATKSFKSLELHQYNDPVNIHEYRHPNLSFLPLCGYFGQLVLPF